VTTVDYIVSEIDTRRRAVQQQAEFERRREAAPEKQAAPEKLQYWDQGDALLYEKDALARRIALRRHPLVRGALHRWWETALRSVQTGTAGRRPAKGEADGAGGEVQVTRIKPWQYRLVMHKVYKALVEEWNPEAADACALEDWERDSKGGEDMTRELFNDALFELADVWTHGIDPRLYQTFLDMLFLGIAVPVDGAVPNERECGSRAVASGAALGDELHKEQADSSSRAAEAAVALASAAHFWREDDDIQFIGDELEEMMENNSWVSVGGTHAAASKIATTSLAFAPAPAFADDAVLRAALRVQRHWRGKRFLLGMANFRREKFARRTLMFHHELTPAAAPCSAPAARAADSSAAAVAEAQPKNPACGSRTTSRAAGARPEPNGGRWCQCPHTAARCKCRRARLLAWRRRRQRQVVAPLSTPDQLGGWRI
jgi:hypothetical protein